MTGARKLVAGRTLVGVLATCASLLWAAPALACSKDDTAYFDGFLDATCLQTPLAGTTIDTFGGLRLTTNGTPTAANWDSDSDFANGVTYQTTLFGPVGLSTLATNGSGAAATLGLPTTLLPLTRDAGNPALSPTAAATLDNDNVDDPSVARVGSSYVMWYSGTAEDGSGPAIFEATSSNGTSWTRANGGGSVLSGTPGAFDKRGAFGPDVVYDPTDVSAPYRMWYSGEGDVFGAIGYATSTDGVSWTKHDDAATPAAADPVLDHGPAGSPDSFAAADPSVLRDGATWKMWYSGDDSNKKRIAYATSQDGIAWTKGGKVISPEDPGANANYAFGAFAPSVYRLASGSYEMLLVGRKLVSGTTFQTKIMDASSSDGISWTAPSPALNPSGTSSKFDFSNLNAPFVLPDPTDSAAPFKLWYSGNTVDANGNFHTRVGYAKSNNGTSFGKVQSGPGVNADGSVLDIGALSTSFGARQASGLSVVAPASANPSFAGFYWGTRGSDFKPRLGEATSTDGTSWSKVSVSAPDGGALFALGNGGTFDNGGERDPAALYDGGIYDLYFTALDSGGTRSIGLASSAENVTTHQPANSWSARTKVLAADGSGFDTSAVSHPSVIRDGSTYVMYYTGWNGSTPSVGCATSTSASFSSVTRDACTVLAGTASTFDAAGVKDPVVIKVASGDYRMLYTGLESTLDGPIERVGYATSADGLTWTKQGFVLNPSQQPYGEDEIGVEPTGMLLDGTTLHVYTSGIDRTGRTRGDHETTAYPTPGSPAAGVPNAWATYQLGDASTTVRDFRSITRASSGGGGVTLWMSFLQPYSSAGNEFWSAYFPVTLSNPTEALNFLLTVRGVRWQARLSEPSGAPSIDDVAISHAPVSFSPAGSATTTDISPPPGQPISAWGDLTVSTTLFSPAGGGSGGGTVTVRDSSSGAPLATQALSTGGDTTLSLAGVAPAVHPALRITLDLTSDGSATPLVRSLKVLYNAGATPAPALTLTTPTPVITFGQQATLIGSLSRAGTPLASQTVSLLQQPAGASAFAPLASPTTDAGGNYQMQVSPGVTTTYGAGYTGVSTNPTISIAVRHLVSFKAVRKGGKGLFSGKLAPVEPRHPIQIMRLRSGAWVPFAATAASSTSTFKLTKAIKTCQRYTFKAVAPADAQHQAGESAPVQVEHHRLTLNVAVRSRKATFTGKVAPTHPGKVVLIQVKKGIRFVTYAKVKLSKRSTFTVVKRLKRGRQTFRASLPTDRCHFGGVSRARAVSVK